MKVSCSGPASSSLQQQQRRSCVASLPLYRTAGWFLLIEMVVVGVVVTMPNPVHGLFHHRRRSSATLVVTKTTTSRSTRLDDSLSSSSPSSSLSPSPFVPFSLQLLRVRGGSSYHHHDHNTATTSTNTSPPQQRGYPSQYQQQQQYQQRPSSVSERDPNWDYSPEQQNDEDDGNYQFAPFMTTNDDDDDTTTDPFHETVQDRVDTWKTQQREYGPQLQASPRDERGRMKLLTSVSRGSRALIFFLLLWRNVHLYEVADQLTSSSSLKRFVLVTPLVILFLGNLMGVVASLTSPGHAAKRRLKAILNLDKFVEVLLIGHALVRLTVAPSSPYVPREIHITNILHSFLFILQCQAFTRLSWDENAAQPMHSYQRQAQQAQQPPSYVEENSIHRLGDDDNEDGFGYDNPFRRQY